MLRRLKHRLGATRGWRRRLLAAALGALATLALPPLHAVPALVPAFVGLVWLVDSSAGARRAFADGWWFGVGFFGAGLYWISFALLVEAERFAWFIPAVVAGLAAGFALFAGACAGLQRLAAGGEAAGAGRVLVFAALWTALEWVRGVILTGFPWNLVASVWTFSDAMMQPAAAIGAYGLGLLTVTAAAIPAILADDAGGGARRGLAWTGAALIALALAAGAGLVRLGSGEPAAVEGVRLRLVQPNIPQRLKWRPELRVGHVRDQLELSQRAPATGGPPTGVPPTGGPPTHVIWSETAVPFFVAGQPALLAAIGEATPPGGLTIVGAPRTTPEPTTPFQVWNSLHAIDGGGRVVATYDKAHLVPFGEYVPWRRWLGFLAAIAGDTDFSAGEGRRTLELPGLPPASPLICYEVIFPGEVVDAERRARWMLNLTNDAWYGRTPGPYQHFAAARMRAVEEGLPLVRVANTGISAIVDPYGRTVASLGLGERGVVDGPLPAALAQPPPYARFGNAIPLALAAAALVLGLALGRRAKREGDRRARG